MPCALGGFTVGCLHIIIWHQLVGSQQQSSWSALPKICCSFTVSYKLSAGKCAELVAKTFSNLQELLQNSEQWHY